MSLYVEPASGQAAPRRGADPLPASLFRWGLCGLGAASLLNSVNACRFTYLIFHGRFDSSPWPYMLGHILAGLGFLALAIWASRRRSTAALIALMTVVGGGLVLDALSHANQLPQVGGTVMEALRLVQWLTVGRGLFLGWLVSLSNLHLTLEAAFALRVVQNLMVLTFLVLAWCRQPRD